jgi:hypothetical protein
MWYVHHGNWIQALTHTKGLLLFYWIILHDHLLHMLSTSSGSILSYYKWESCPLSCIYFQLVQDQSVLSYYYKWGSYVVFLASILNVGSCLGWWDPIIILLFLWLALSTRHCGSQIPTCASIWPYPAEIILGFSAASILTFYWNNHLLEVLT